jgi:hypothetical protein
MIATHSAAEAVPIPRMLSEYFIRRQKNTVPKDGKKQITRL